jgi:hypothetical protein
MPMDASNRRDANTDAAGAKILALALGNIDRSSRRARTGRLMLGVDKGFRVHAAIGA